MKSRYMPWLLIGGAALYLWWRNRNLVREEPAPDLNFEKPLPPGSVATGNVTETSGNRPGEESLGYAKRTFAEILYPTGERDWIEFKIGDKFRFQ